MAENANLTMHNLLPARGALVRDAKAWADYLTESIRLFGDKSDVMFAAHGIPQVSARAEIVAFLSNHRDAYKFLHDQTVWLMNSGLTGPEIAGGPGAAGGAFETVVSIAGYYGTMSHNAKAVYQRYLGWYDGNPAHLNPLPPEPAAKRYVDAMGGAGAVATLAETAAAAGELRWAATLLNHLVFADETNVAAREALAAIYTRLGFEAEAGTWRNIYLTGAQELRTGPAPLPPAGFSPDVLAATTTAMLFDFMAVRINPQKASARAFKINLVLVDRSETHLITVENGVLIHEAGVQDQSAGATIHLSRPDLLVTLLAGAPMAPALESGAIKIDGDPELYAALIELISNPSHPTFQSSHPEQPATPNRMRRST